MPDATPGPHRNRPQEIMTEADILAATIGEPTRVDSSIVLVDYDPEWPARYKHEAAKIRAALGARILSLEHIGSTSVPGLCAKPIIDIQLLVEDSGDEASYADALTAVGYTLRIREPEWEEHRLFKGTDPDVNLHVFSRGSRQAARHLRFRDAIRANDEERDRYAAAKRALAAQRWAYVQNYADAKNDVIDDILVRAGNTIPRG
jgi:GrpB-like predicted nucleotidyltransferase (UPF0157 family)